MNRDDPHHLQRFVLAQETNYADALAELRAGEKRTHWMWYVFPQAEGLGHSTMARTYAIRSRAEGIAYLAHPVLEPRLNECAVALLHHPAKSIHSIMGSPDDVKLRSSMTLFAALSPAPNPFQQVLDVFYHGETDPSTLAFLQRDA